VERGGAGYGGGAGEVKREGEVLARVRGGAGNVAGPFIAAVWRYLAGLRALGASAMAVGGGYPAVEVLGRDSR
jgi:hypothetical protein